MTYNCFIESKQNLILLKDSTEAMLRKLYNDSILCILQNPDRLSKELKENGRRGKVRLAYLKVYVVITLT